MTDTDRLLQMLEAISEAQDRTHRRQDATAKAVTNLARGLSAAEEIRQRDDTQLAQMRQAILELIASDRAKTLSSVTGEDLADHCTIETVSRARNILWARKKGEPDPLPPPPHANVPREILGETTSGALVVATREGPTVVHAHRRKGDRKDDSVTIRTDRHGDVRLKTDMRLQTIGVWVIKFGGWLVGAGFGIYEAIKKILHH